MQGLPRSLLIAFGGLCPFKLTLDISISIGRFALLSLLLHQNPTSTRSRSGTSDLWEA